MNASPSTSTDDVSLVNITLFHAPLCHFVGAENILLTLCGSEQNSDLIQDSTGAHYETSYSFEASVNKITIVYSTDGDATTVSL